MFFGYLILGAIGGVIAAMFMLLAGYGAMTVFLTYMFVGAGLTIALAVVNCVAARFFVRDHSNADSVNKTPLL